MKFSSREIALAGLMAGIMVVVTVITRIPSFMLQFPLACSP
ncbi:hypothetical protein N752_22780 [Desulforamulus aquiferis]|nr:hypothetical protein [Desulforamulus aquiferis]RYD02842.1 hypothetical protein N752_22780 [Desulforamulus aquiferis]